MGTPLGPVLQSVPAGVASRSSIPRTSRRGSLGMSMSRLACITWLMGVKPAGVGIVVVEPARVNVKVVVLLLKTVLVKVEGMYVAIYEY